MLRGFDIARSDLDSICTNELCKRANGGLSTIKIEDIGDGRCNEEMDPRYAGNTDRRKGEWVFTPPSRRRVIVWSTDGCEWRREQNR